MNGATAYFVIGKGIQMPISQGVIDLLQSFAPADNAPTAATDTPFDSPAVNWPLVAGGAAVLAVAYFLFRRKRK